MALWINIAVILNWRYGVVWYDLVGMVWFGMGGGQMTSEFIHEEVTIMDYHELSNLITNLSNIY